MGLKVVLKFTPAQATPYTHAQSKLKPVTSSQVTLHIMCLFYVFIIIHHWLKRFADSRHCCPTLSARVQAPTCLPLRVQRASLCQLHLRHPLFGTDGFVRERLQRTNPQWAHMHFRSVRWSCISVHSSHIPHFPAQRIDIQPRFIQPNETSTDPSGDSACATFQEYPMVLSCNRALHLVHVYRPDLRRSGILVHGSCIL